MTDATDATTAAPPDPAAEQVPGTGTTAAATGREVLSPREVAQRAGFSYHAILRAIRRGDLKAYEPIPGQYRIKLGDYDQWLHRPARRAASSPPSAPRRERARANSDPDRPASYARLRAIDGKH
jgi:excisionase family DNA binding protein